MQIALLRNPPDSEDAVQEAALKVFLNLAHLEDRSRFRAWLLQIVINQAHMYRRRLRRSLYQSLDNVDVDNEQDSVPQQFVDWHELPDEALDRAELRRAVEAAVNTLPGIYREVLILIDN